MTGQRGTPYIDLALSVYRRALVAITDDVDQFNEVLPSGPEVRASVPPEVLRGLAAYVVIGPPPSPDDRAALAELDREDSDLSMAVVAASHRLMFAMHIAMEVRAVYEGTAAPDDATLRRDVRAALGMAADKQVQAHVGTNPDDEAGIDWLIAYSLLTQASDGGWLANEMTWPDEEEEEPDE